jgi:Fic family protein
MVQLMKKEEFSSNSAGRLIEQKLNGITYNAFVPNLLPPKFELDHELTKALENASIALGELKGLGHLIQNPELLINPFMKLEASLSSRIEGTQADITDLYALEAGQLALPGFSTPAPKEDVREVQNYIEALKYGLESLKQGQPLNLYLIRTMHKILMTGVRGKHANPGSFRQVQNWIGGYRSLITEAEYVPPPVLQMETALRDLETYIEQSSQDDYAVLIKIALIHYQFEAIHPFVDGNGRIGRLLISLLLVHWHILPLPLLYLSAFFERYRTQYYDLLQAVSTKGAWRDWLLFFLYGVELQAKDAAEKAKELLNLKNHYHSLLQKSKATALTFRVVDELFNSFPLTSSSLMRLKFNISYNRANRIIEKLVSEGILEQIELSSKKIYVAWGIVNIVR